MFLRTSVTSFDCRRHFLAKHFFFLSLSPGMFCSFEISESPIRLSRISKGQSRPGLAKGKPIKGDNERTFWSLTISTPHDSRERKSHKSLILTFDYINTVYSWKYSHRLNQPYAPQKAKHPYCVAKASILRCKSIDITMQ